MARNKEKKIQRRKNIMAAITIILMVGSAFAVIFYGFASASQNFSYNGYKFKFGQSKYVTKFNGNDLSFYNKPEQVLTFNVSDQEKKVLGAPVAYVVFDPNDVNIQYADLVRYELSDLSVKGTLSTIFNFAMDNESVKYDLPVISCANATESQPVIYFKTSVSTQITLESPNCVLMESSYGGDMLRERDLLVYLQSKIIS